MYRIDAHAGGGVAILVRSDVTYTELQLTKFFPSCFEVLGINIYLQNGTPLSVLCAYNPNKIVTTRELMHYTNQLQPACVVVGDFNAHHPMWEPTKPASTTGRNIAQMLLDDPSISLITPPSLPTYYNVYQNSFSTLDLTFVSANFQPTVAVTTEEDMGSDHYPVVTSIRVAPSTAGFRKRSTWKFGSGTWENWTAALQQPELQGMDDLQREFTNFTISKANALADHYRERLTSPSPSPFPQHTLIPLAIALNDDTPSVINDPFNIQELNRVLTSMRGTATGHDDIHNEHLKHMPDNYKTWLLQLYNKSLQSGMLPTVWQPAIIIIPLPKPNKPLTSVDSYRPISLLSCVQKLMERLIVSRLTFFLEQKGVFRKTQGGYRRRLSAIHQVTKLEAAIRTTLVNKSILLCLFVDFSSAFETVWPMGVLYKLSRCRVRGTMLRWLQAYLKDRPVKFGCAWGILSNQF
ncbi:Endonuclease/exonuclease/phosphatase [Trinorchestia longiramus]|nr:Endonuclease/exonuclease/phosphatase [Trinorchestia longiramus]